MKNQDTKTKEQFGHNTKGQFGHNIILLQCRELCGCE